LRNFLTICRSWQLSELLCLQIVNFPSFSTICKRRNSHRGLKEESIFLRGGFQDNAELNIFSPNKQEKIILAPQTSADEDDAIATNASATRATGGQRRHQRDVVDRAIATRATTPAVLLGHEGGGHISCLLCAKLFSCSLWYSTRM
jgi:hypothetical protein